MVVVDIADEIYRELEQPTDISIPSIVFWLQTNIGLLNNLIGADYELSAGREVTTSSGTEIGITEAAIYKQLYKVYRAKNLVRRHLGAASTEVVLSVDSDGASVKRVNKTTLASEYRQLAKEEQSNLDKLVQTYSLGKCKPIQVAGDDTVASIRDVDYCDYTTMR